MIENLHKIVAFDGLSLAGKSMMVGMINERAAKTYGKKE